MTVLTSVGKKFETNEFNSQVALLIASARSCAPKTPLRAYYLTKLIRLIQSSDRLWVENSPYYEEALQLTWLYLCRNICEPTTAKNAYDPNISQITTWLNTYLKYRLLSLKQKAYNERKLRVDNPLILDNLEASNPETSILEEIQDYVVKDPSGKLISTHVKGRADINCQKVILTRLTTSLTWEQLACEWNIPFGTLSAFYNRQCRKMLRQIAVDLGYITS